MHSETDYLTFEKHQYDVNLGCNHCDCALCFCVFFSGQDAICDVQSIGTLRCGAFRYYYAGY